MLDILIKNGYVIDGKSNKGYLGDVGIKDSKLVLDPKDDAKKIIDASGLIVAPGFIDMHTHSDLEHLKLPTCDSKLFQGVTTEIAGCCGYTYFPSLPDNIDDAKNTFDHDQDFVSVSYETFVEKNNNPRAINWGTYVGHGTLRAGVVGEAAIKASDDQIKEMQKLLDKDLTDGALGLSLGLEYPPGCFGDKDEFIQLAKVLKKHNKILTSHIRNENRHVFESIDELIDIGRRSGAHVHISHTKLGVGNWFKTEELFEKLSDARSEGIHVTYEVYPYHASSTGLSVIVPKWAHDGGFNKMIERFSTEYDQIVEGIKASSSYEMGLERIIVVSTHGFMPEADGRNLVEIAEMLNMNSPDAIIHLLKEAGNLPTIRFTMQEEDVHNILSQTDSVIISDGSAISLDPSVVDGKPHPRNYGTFPRFLRLNRENEWMSIEKAVHKMTGLPAKYLGIDRGVIEENTPADLTIFNKDIITDCGGFDEPYLKPEGIEFVIVNGECVLENGIITNQLPGQIIKKI